MGKDRLGRSCFSPAVGEAWVEVVRLFECNHLLRKSAEHQPGE